MWLTSKKPINQLWSSIIDKRHGALGQMYFTEGVNTLASVRLIAVALSVA